MQFYIIAESESDAEYWGKAIANAFYAALHDGNRPSWSSEEYAAEIKEVDREQVTVAIHVGEMPDFDVESKSFNQ